MNEGMKREGVNGNRPPHSRSFIHSILQSSFSRAAAFFPAGASRGIAPCVKSMATAAEKAAASRVSCCAPDCVGKWTIW